MTYRVRPGGRQFVVIAAGGHGTLGTRAGDAVVAYALPESPDASEAELRSDPSDAAVKERVIPFGAVEIPGAAPP